MRKRGGWLQGWRLELYGCRLGCYGLLLGFDSGGRGTVVVRDGLWEVAVMGCCCMVICLGVSDK